MILPDGNFGTAEENVLPSSRLCVLLLDLNLANHAGMLNDLGDVCLVLSSDFTGNSLHQVDVTSVHPVLPEDSNSRRSNPTTVWSDVGLNHAVGTVDRPKEEEYDEHVVSIPETFEVGTTHLLDRSNNHTHERGQHDVSSPSWSCNEIGE